SITLPAEAQWSVSIGAASLSITATNSVTVIGQPTEYKGIPITPLGAASLAVVSNVLAVGNIGSSGADGVSFSLGGAHSTSVTWADRDPVTYSNGFTLNV